MSGLIEPRTLKGFRDYAPALMIPRERVLETARRVYRSYGFAPIDTPAMEYAEVLLGKGGGENDKIVYRFRDHGDRDVALRFDLTVPFARFAAAEVPKLGTPFKRYAMGPVWRGENTGHGRYREFWQCDFDTIGTKDNAVDIEAALVINDLLTAIGIERFSIRVNNRKLLNGILGELQISDKSVPVLRAIDKLGKVGREPVRDELVGAPKEEAIALARRISERVNQHPLPDGKAGFAELYGSILTDTSLTLLGMSATHVFPNMADMISRIAMNSFRKRILAEPSRDPRTTELRQKIATRHGDKVLGVIDQLIAYARSQRYSHFDESAEQELITLITGAGLTPDQADQVLGFVSSENPEEVLRRLEQAYPHNRLIVEGIDNLRQLLSVTSNCGLPASRIAIDLSIARGLDYYTGTIYETFLTDLPGIGSVCSGGRYDNLASLYTKQVLPGVGASLGVDRLLAAMEELKHPWLTGRSTPADVLVVQFDGTRLGDYQRAARDLRAAGVAVEVYPEAKRPKPQFEYADKRGFRLALIAGPDEFAQGVWKVKDLARREEQTVPAAGLVSAVLAALGGAAAG